MPKKLPCMFPRGARGRDVHWLYAIGAASGITKIGMTLDPQLRMYAHRSSLGVFTWFHLFSSMPRWVAYEAESRALPKLAMLGQRIGRTETFTGLSREQTIAVVRQAIAAAHESQLKAERAWAERRALAVALAEFRRLELPKMLPQPADHPAAAVGQGA